MSPESVMTSHCCKSACINKLTLNQVQHARQSFIRNYGTNEKQRQFVLDWLDSNRPKEEENQFCYSVCGITVCVTCWLNSLGITRRKFYMLKKEYVSNRRSGTHGNAGMFKMSWCSEIVLTYLTNYFEHMCDYMPTRNVMHLPSNIRKHEVYEEMKATLESQGQTCCSRPTFNNLWKKHFPNVKIPKENRFGKCDTCSQIKKQLKEKQEFEEKELIYASRARHHEFVRKERQTYINRSIKGHREPNSYFSVAIDGMDQNKTELPFSPLRFSLLNTAWRLKVHVVGVMVHGRSPILFLDYQQHLHDSNLTINILLQVFWMHRARLTDIVFLQMDNTCRENKNQFVFALCSYLIETKVFKEIHISFLPKGHTHIDVDQLFSRLSVAISRNGCLTPTDLHRLIGSCYKQSKGETTQEGATPKVSPLQYVYAIREWLMPYIDEVHNLRPFHQFKFYLNEEGKCLTDFKPWCVDEWDAQKWPPLKILKNVPESEPEVIVPSYEMVDINRLSGMVEKCVFGGVLNKKEEEEWVNFLDEQQKVIQSYEDMEQVHYCTENGNKSKYHNKDLKYIPAKESGWIIDDLLSRQKPSPAETPSLCAVLKENEDLQNGRGIIPAYTGPYRNPRHIQRNIIRDQSIEDVEEGMLVAVNLQKYKERPQIGKVIALNEKTIEVEWYNGSWTTQWKPHKVRQGRHLVVWKEEISKSCVILESTSVKSSSIASPPSQNKSMSDMSISSVDENTGFLDGSTPRISLHPVAQTIQLKNDGIEGSMCVYGNQVEIVSSQNANSNITASNKIKINQIVKYDWDMKYYRGNLIAMGGQFIAYTLKGRNSFVVRVLNPQTASRALIKGFTGLVTDLAFAHSLSSTMACVDEGGNVFVWNIKEHGDKIEYKLKLHVKRSPIPTSDYHRIYWCPYLPDDEEDEEAQEDKDSIDVDDRSLAITHDNQAEVIDVDMVVARCGCYEVTIEMLEQGEGYISIIDGHTKPITDGSLSPDSAVLATGSEDGYVRFWQVGDMMPDGDHKCLHAFQPHDGAPLSSIAFCDNHIEHEKDVPMWRFMITGAEYNREIKIWCTVQWNCLQTLRFSSPTADIASVLGDSYFKLQLDATARYLVLSDIGRKVLYVLLVHQDRIEGQAHVSSITDFQLTQPLLSFVIKRARLFKLKKADQQLVQENGNHGNHDVNKESYDADMMDELDESELGSLQKRKNLMVQLGLYSIHTKSLQELLVHLQPEPSVAPPTPTMISSLNTSIGQGPRDALSDLSIDTGTGTELSVDLDESDAASDSSTSIKPKLIAPDAFTHTSKDSSRPDSNASNVSSGTLVSALETSQPDSVENSVRSSITSRLSDSSRSSLQEAASQKFFGPSTGILTPTSLPLPATPPFSVAPDPTAIPIPTFKSSPLSPVAVENENIFKASPTASFGDKVKELRTQEDLESEDRSLTPVADITEEGMKSSASIGKDPIAVTKVIKSESTESEPFIDDVIDENATLEEKSVDSSWITASDRHSPREHTPHINLTKTKKAIFEPSLVSSPVSRVDIPPESPRQTDQDLSSTLNELLQLVRSQQKEIMTLKMEVTSNQTQNGQRISELVQKEVKKLEDTVLERLNGGLAQHSMEEHQRLEKALRERQTADKKKQEHLTSTLSQAVTNSITGKLDKTIKNEMKNNVIPAVQKVLVPIQEELNTTMGQKLTAADAVLRDSINKMVKNKGVVESIGSSAASALQGPIQDSYREAFQNTILPAFERACQSMFTQINESFQKGTHQYLEMVTRTLESKKREEREALDPALEQLQSNVQLLRSESQRNNSNLVMDVESVLQKQLATALQSLREEMVSRFDTQVKVSVQEAVKTEIHKALEEMRETYIKAAVPETAPQLASVDHKKHIGDLIQGGHVAQAFQEALTASDLNLVVFVCEAVDSNELFSQTNNQLSQPVLLSLIQQLSVDLLSNTELKHRYLKEAVMLLDPKNEVTREHMPTVLQGLCQHLNFAISECSGMTQRNLKVLRMAAKSLLM